MFKHLEKKSSFTCVMLFNNELLQSHASENLTINLVCFDNGVITETHIFMIEATLLMLQFPPRIPNKKVHHLIHIY